MFRSVSSAERKFVNSFAVRYPNPAVYDIIVYIFTG